MDLLNYLPSSLLDMAVAVGQDRLLVTRLDLEPEAELLVCSVAAMLEGGAKLITPSAKDCEDLKDFKLNILAENYAQPYSGLGIILPASLTGGTKDCIGTIVWSPGDSIVVICFGERQGTDDGGTMAYHIVIPYSSAETIEEILENHTVLESRDLWEAGEQRQIISMIKVMLNLCLFAVDRGVRVMPLDGRAEKRRRKARHDERMARLAARDAQEIIIQDLDMTVRATSPSVGGGGESDGRRQGMHRRRGHWKMQAHGPGQTLRKRIFVQSYMVHLSDNQDGEVQSILS